ncbi:MAG: metallophosphoesterase [Solirubrobacteraceae bacterium]
MSVRRLIISDCHFGSGDDLLRSPLALERIEPELEWADEVVINGDLLELVFASLAEAVAAARPFLSLVNRHVERIHFLPGNHDHHLVALAGDERRLAELTGDPDPAPFRVMPAERLLRALCPGVAVITSYPICELDGMRFIHGHYIAPHIESFGWRMMDRLAWSLTGEEQRPERLTIGDYESLISPLYELMYEMANLPQGRRAQQQFERWLIGMGAVARAPGKASRQAVGFAHGLARRRNAEEMLEPMDAPTGQILAAMEAVCLDLSVPPGTVVFAHTHTPLTARQSHYGHYTFWNSGSWLWDRRIRDDPTYRQSAWPGTLLRATGGALELRRLLDDCDERDLRTMLGSVPEPRRRRLRLSRRALLRPAA